MDGTGFWRWFRLQDASGLNDAVAAGDVVEDSLDKDDADVNAAGDVGKKFGEEIVGGVEGVAGEDAGDGGGAV